jgi:hypothetical protein
VNDTTVGIRVRPGGLADAPAVLNMLDSAVVWMNGRGNTEQWGTTPYSRKPGGVARVQRYMTENAPYIVAFYERNGFTPTDRFLSGDWPGQVLARRVGRA